MIIRKLPIMIMWYRRDFDLIVLSYVVPKVGESKIDICNGQHKWKFRTFSLNIESTEFRLVLSPTIIVGHT